MNIQAMMKQAQKLQKDMMKAQDELNNKIFESKNSMVSIKMSGNYEVKEIKILLEEADADDIEMLNDALCACMNTIINQIKDETETKMGAYTKGLSGTGLF